MSAPTTTTQQSPFEALPRTIATSYVLPYVTSNDWLNFRVASRSCYELVHDTRDVSLSTLNSINQTHATSNTSGDGENDESESLWRLALVRDYGFEGTEDENILHQSIHSPANSRDDAFLSTDNIFTAPNSFISWKHWRKIDISFHHRTRPRGSHIPPSERVVGPYFLRAGSMWQKIEQWCDDENRSGGLGREIKSSLLPGRPIDPNSNGGTQNAQLSAVKAVYAFYAGQCDLDAPTGRPPHHFNPFTGLFGGFQAYHIISSTRWEDPELDDNCGYLIIAQDENKGVLLNFKDGQVNVLMGGGRHLPATGGTGGIDQRSSSILRWFEEHANSLHQNFYSVGNIYINNTSSFGGPRPLLSLLRFPTVVDTTNCSCAVTRGVEIVTSAIFSPEMELFVYSIRIRLLTPNDGEGYMSPEQRGFTTCQLVSRYWKISKTPPDGSGTPSVEEVRGEGVIGMYPLLHEGGYTNYEGEGAIEEMGRSQGVFTYQSCTEAVPGLMEGYLQFRPGSLAEPSGEIFDVRVAPFPLKFSEFLY